MDVPSLHLPIPVGGLAGVYDQPLGLEPPLDYEGRTQVSFLSLSLALGTESGAG